jgi:hypothetical protein
VSRPVAAARRAAARVAAVVAATVLASASACGTERDMSDRMEMPDSMPVVEAMHDEAMRDSMLDVMPGGEMARGDSAASMRLLEKKR